MSKEQDERRAFHGRHYTIEPMTHQPRASFQSPRFAQPATFMRLPHVEDPHGLDVAIVGVPYDGGTSYRPGAQARPARDPRAVVADPDLQLLPEGRAVRRG